MIKPVSLVNISFFDKEGKKIVSESESKIFGSFERMQIYIESRKKYWSDLYGLEEIEVEPDSIETLSITEAQQVLKHVCEYLELDYTRVSSKLQDSVFVDARRIAINICFERKMAKSNIAKALKLNHATIYHHLRKHKGFIEVQNGYEQKYNEIMNYVMGEIGGNFQEDGSGEKKKDD